MKTICSRSTIRYVHEGAQISAEWRSNSHTLLQHLREDRGLKGTKEGCAEGDCGACVVVVGQLAADKDCVQYRAINSCIAPLSAMDGRLLIAVENLAAPDGQLHPVQQAMVECHASQCGFCTPGFVMSLYGQYVDSDVAQSTDRLHELLAGNLCRCTGYAPILRAACRMHDLPRVERDREADLRALRELDRENLPSVIAGQHDIAVLPRSSDQIADALLAHPNATLVAGSTDVGLWITKQKRPLPIVIHVSHATDLANIRQDASGFLIGAAARIADMAPLLNEAYPELVEYWSRFASPPVRNAGTLGGNIANASPIGDSMPALIALGAGVVLRCGDKRREAVLEDFYLGYQKKDLRPSEFVEAIRIPPRRGQIFIRAYKISKRFDDDISAVSMGLALHMAGERILEARVAFGGMAAVPKRALAAEAVLRGRALDEATMDLAARALPADFTPMSDHRASTGYRAKVAGNLLRRAALEFAGAEPTRVVDYVRGSAV